MATKAAPLDLLVPYEKLYQVSQNGSHEYSAHLLPESCFATTAHGGAVVAILWRTILLHFRTTHQKLGQYDLIAIHVEFLRPTSNGDIKVVLRDARIGKGSSTVAATCVQRGKETVLVTATVLSESATATQPTQYMDYKHDLPPIDFAAVEASRDPNWILSGWRQQPGPQTNIQHVIAVVPRVAPSAKTEWAVWYSPRLPGVRWTTPEVGLLADCNFMVPERYHHGSLNSYDAFIARALRNERAGDDPFEQPRWSVPRYYTTANMSIDVRRQLPPGGEKWLLMRCKTRELVSGRYEIQSEVWDVHGRLIAVVQSLWFCIDLKKRPGMEAGLNEQSKM